MKLGFITQLSSSAKAELANDIEELLELEVDGVEDECPHCEQEARFAIDNPFEPKQPTRDFLQRLVDVLREP